MAGVVGSGRQSLLQPSPYPLAGVVPVSPAKRLVVPQGGVVLSVANLLTAANLEASNVDLLSVTMWGVVCTDATLTTLVTRYTNLPWLWMICYRQSQAVFTASDIKTPTWPPDSNPTDATKGCDAPLISGAAHGINLQGQATVGFRLSIDDILTYPDAVGVVDYYIARTVQG